MMDDKYIIFQIGPKGQGGINTMIDSIVNSPLNNKYQFYRVETIVNKSKFIPYIKAFITCVNKKNKVSLAHVHMSINGSYLRKSILIKYLYMNKIPVIIHLHGGKFECFYNNQSNICKKMIRNTFAMSSKVIVLTKNWLPFIHMLGAEEKSIVIPNFTQIPDIGKKVINQHGECKILFLGKLVKQKGVYDLIDAISCLNKDRTLSKTISCVLAGNGEINRAKVYIKKLNLEDVISVMGWVNDNEKEELLLTSDIRALPSYCEAFGLSLIEGMSYGIPVIGTTAGAMPDVVNNEEDGFLIEPGNTKELIEKLKLLIEDNELRYKMGCCGRKHVKREYGLDTFCDKLNGVYEEFI